MIQLPKEMNPFEFVAVATLRAGQLMRGAFRACRSGTRRRRPRGRGRGGKVWKLPGENVAKA
jgi:hypothetical protein